MNTTTASATTYWESDSTVNVSRIGIRGRQHVDDVTEAFPIRHGPHHRAGRTLREIHYEDHTSETPSRARQAIHSARSGLRKFGSTVSSQFKSKSAKNSAPSEGHGHLGHIHHGQSSEVTFNTTISGPAKPKASERVRNTYNKLRGRRPA